MSRYSIAEAERRFAELVQRALRGEDVVIARNDKPVLRLVALGSSARRRTPGSARHLIEYIAPDFDDTPPEFDESIR